MGKVIIKKRIKTLAALFLSGGFVFCALFFPDNVRQNILSALSICTASVIPSLFPMLCVANFTALSDIAGKTADILSRFPGKLLRLPGKACFIYVMSVFGGYPVGAALTAHFVESGELSRKSAKRLMCFCVNGGVGFLIISVGSSMLASRLCGLLIFAANTLAGFIICVLTIPFSKTEQTPINKTEYLSYSAALVHCVADSARAMISVCSWIILFFSVNGMLSGIFQDGLPPFITYISEVTSACISAAKTGDTVLLSAVSAFGGICVHMQLLPYLTICGIKFRFFLFTRCLHAALSAALALLAAPLFPDIPISAAKADIIQPRIFSISTISSIFLLIMSAILIFDIVQDEKMC